MTFSISRDGGAFQVDYCVLPDPSTCRETSIGEEYRDLEGYFSQRLSYCQSSSIFQWFSLSHNALCQPMTVVIWSKPPDKCFLTFSCLNAYEFLLIIYFLRIYITVPQLQIQFLYNHQRMLWWWI